MKNVRFNLGKTSFSFKVPDKSDVLKMGKVKLLENPEEKIHKSLSHPIGSLSVKNLVQEKLKQNPYARAVLVISDITRPVPYTGEQGILYPLIQQMKEAGLPSSQILVLVATGVHRAMSDKELRDFLDPRIFQSKIRIINHDSRKPKELVYAGQTEFGGDIHINRFYVQSDIKICTGLVESHFMAGVSGGRKAICPGLISEESTYLLHSGPILAHPKAKDLVLKGNPVHEEALKVAQIAGCGFILNVTLDSQYRLTGVFAGDLVKAHLKAVDKLKQYASIPVHKKYDLVISHSGYVGINHYQTAKAGVVCSSILKDNGLCVLASHHTDTDPIGSSLYKKMLKLMGKKGAQPFEDLITDPSWTFVPEQWEAQMWGRLFKKIPFENLIYCTQEISSSDFSWLPGTDARSLFAEAFSLKQLTEQSVFWAMNKLRSQGIDNPQVAVLLDGPYGIPVYQKN